MDTYIDHQYDVVDVATCEVMCYENPLCSWYSYDPAGFLCMLLDGCDFMVESCPECTSGESECGIRPM